ncbi:MAG TPA: hypothetical protein VGV09_04095 [Steroidobacteraceae bacterium]|nr:hypothetical protein [Steroidobacteraceae bacterium]
MAQNSMTLEGLAAEAATLREHIEQYRVRLEEIETLVRLAEKYNLCVDRHIEVVPEPKRVTDSRLFAAIHRAARDMTIRDRIILGCESILDDGKRRLSRELVPELAKLGVNVGGKDPAGNLAAYLSKEKDRFDSNIKLGGWSLTRLTRRANPGDADTSPGLFSNNGLTGAQHPITHG